MLVFGAGRLLIRMLKAHLLPNAVPCIRAYNVLTRPFIGKQDISDLVGLKRTFFMVLKIFGTYHCLGRAPFTHVIGAVRVVRRCHRSISHNQVEISFLDRVRPWLDDSVPVMRGRHPEKH